MVANGHVCETRCVHDPDLSLEDSNISNVKLDILSQVLPVSPIGDPVPCSLHDLPYQHSDFSQPCMPACTILDVLNCTSCVRDTCTDEYSMLHELPSVVSDTRTIDFDVCGLTDSGNSSVESDDGDGADPSREPPPMPCHATEAQVGAQFADFASRIGEVEYGLNRLVTYLPTFRVELVNCSLQSLTDSFSESQGQIFARISTLAERLCECEAHSSSNKGFDVLKNLVHQLNVRCNKLDEYISTLKERTSVQQDAIDELCGDFSAFCLESTGCSFRG